MGNGVCLVDISRGSVEGEKSARETPVRSSVSPAVSDSDAWTETENKTMGKL